MPDSLGFPIFWEEPMTSILKGALLPLKTQINKNPNQQGENLDQQKSYPTNTKTCPQLQRQNSGTQTQNSTQFFSTIT